MFITLHNIDGVSTVNIKSIEAFFVNTTVQEQLQPVNSGKMRFINRFPIEPVIGQYMSTAYNVNGCGYPSYHAFPQAYTGFGVNPKWNDIYKQIPCPNVTKYRAVVNATSSDTIEVIFPAEDQLFTGVYKLIIVAKLYEPGYNNNLRVVTIDRGNAFELVDSSSEETNPSTGMYVDIDNTSYIDTDAEDRYTIRGKLNKDDGVLTMSYNNGGQFNVDLSEEMSWAEF